jgi:Undecaprenyl-phosphate glucose phosphotransferase
MHIASTALHTPRPRAPGGLAGRSPVLLASDLLPLFDLALLLLFSSLAGWLDGWALLPDDAGRGLAHATLAVSVLAPFMLYDPGFAGAVQRGRLFELLRSHVWRFLLFAAGSVTLMALLAGGGVDDTRSPHVAAWLVGALLLTLLTRVLVGWQVGLMQREGRLAQVVAVVGSGARAQRLVRSLGQAGAQRVELLGVFDDMPAGAAAASLATTGSIAQLIALAATRRIDWIVLALPPMRPQRLRTVLRQLQGLSVPIGLCPQHAGPAGPPFVVDALAGSVPVQRLASRPIARWDAVAKGAEDLLLGGLLTLLLLPLLAAIALAIRLDSPGPVIFRQRRHALDNREFDIFKFRTMTWNPDAASAALTQTARGDRRITRIGRFLRASSLDELPQLFNVLQGTMSLVGPRPHAVDMRTEQRLGADITDLYAHRHRVKPGITGWAQVHGARGATDTTAQLARRVEFDLHYIDHWSLLLDLKILVLTWRAVLQRTNAF